MGAEKISLRLPPELLEQVEQAAENADQLRTTWILEAVKTRLGQATGSHHSYARAVAAAHQAARGKLNRVDAESVAARVICALKQ